MGLLLLLPLAFKLGGSEIAQGRMDTLVHVHLVKPTGCVTRFSSTINWLESILPRFLGSTKQRYFSSLIKNKREH
jgi:hypothetical protein